MTVRIAASGANTKIRAGKAAHAKHPLPAVRGLDMAGTVQETGRGITAFKPGAEAGPIAAQLIHRFSWMKRGLR